MITPVRWTGHEARLLRAALRMSLRAFAAHLGVAERTISKWEKAGPRTTPWPDTQAILDTALAQAGEDAKARFAQLLNDTRAVAAAHGAASPTANVLQPASWQGAARNGGDEPDALELARRVAATDVGTETLGRLEDMVDKLAIKYPVTPPQELLEPVRRHVSYVMRLLDARKTLDEHHRLLVVGGWLSLLAATLYIDLERPNAATSWLATATSLARETGQDEIHAWRYETEAWQVLTDGDYRRAAELSQAAQQFAPRGSSAAIQATAQEGRAWARLGAAKETYDALNRVERFVSMMARPETPEHHYRYDPDKAEAYVATTLAWLGDVAAEHHARHVVTTLTKEVEAGRWARRLASANIDLALALLLTHRMGEAAAVAQESILSGRLVA
ncbi:MAG: helix-turn-helix domain-containing protein, partial [Pseudonocardiaceae bacterium]